jgi:DNA-binding NarL/FixJ family response regulator
LTGDAGKSPIVVVWGTNLLAGLIKAVLPQSGLEVLGATENPQIAPAALLLVDDFPAIPARIQHYLREACGSYPNAPICIISECDYSHLIPERERRIVGYVHTSVAYDALSHIIQVVIAGGEYVYRPPNDSGGAVNEHPEPAALSAREREICELVKQGCSNKLIAQRLGLSDNTVKAHIRRVMRKLGARTRVAIALHRQAAGPR